MPNVPVARAGSSITALAVVLATATVTPAAAKIACPSLCSVPSTVVGSPSGGAGEVRIVVHDVADVPLAFHEVTLEFETTTLRLSPVQESGVTIDCAARTLTRMTDLEGLAVFHPRFGGSDQTGRILVVTEGVPLGQLPGRSTDLDGADGMTGIGDFLAFAASFASSQNAPALNFNASASDVPDLADLALFTREFALAMPMGYCP